MREIALSGGEPPLRVPDTSGPASTDVREGLAPMRADWIAARDVRETGRSLAITASAPDGSHAPGRGPGAPSNGASSPFDHESVAMPVGLHRPTFRGNGPVTQMHYARRGEITPEMEFVAIREGFEPEFVRREVARGSGDHPGQHQPPGARAHDHRAQLPVKINANIGNSAVRARSRTRSRSSAGPPSGVPTPSWTSPPARTSTRPESGSSGTPRSRSAPSRSTRRWRRWAECPEELTWEVYRDTLIEQAEQGVDYFTVHAGVLLRYVPMTASR
jgi:phosphomethylpyrimidine synthase